MEHTTFNPKKITGPAIPHGELLHGDLTFRIIGAAMKVHRTLGPGYPEAIYHEAMKIELASTGLRFESEKTYEVSYDSKMIGHFRADLVVENGILLELKAVDILAPVFRQQVISYLKASGLHVGLLINFGEKSLKHERLVL